MSYWCFRDVPGASEAFQEVSGRARSFQGILGVFQEFSRSYRGVPEAGVAGDLRDITKCVCVVE